jgi:hypothetical protein
MKTQYRNLAIVLIFSQLWRLKPTVSRLIFKKKIHFLAKFLQLMVTHWKPNIEIWRFFPFFLFSLVAIETNFFRIYMYFYISFLAKLLQLMVTQWKPNIEIWRVFPFFFLFLTCGDWNQLLSNIFIFYISIFGEISPGKEPLPLLPTNGPISRLSSLV